MIIDLNRLKEFFSLKNHTHSEYLTSHQDISGKVDKVNGANQITDTTSNFSNLGTLNNVKQSTINTAIDTKIGSIENEIGDIHTLIYGTGSE